MTDTCMKRFVFLLLLASALATADSHPAPTSSAEPQAAPTPRVEASEAKPGIHILLPFEAEFRVHVSRIPTPIKATLSLQPKPGMDDYFVMQMESRSLLLRSVEESHFIWHHCLPISHRYRHTFRGFGFRRSSEMQFDWDQRQVSYENDKDSGSFAITEQTLDEVTMILRARCLLEDGQTEFTLQAAYGEGIRDHHFVVTGEEMVDIPGGEVRAIVIEKKRRPGSKRSTIFWLAPELDYMLVKARHIESRALFGELKLRRYDTAAGRIDESNDAP